MNKEQLDLYNEFKDFPKKIVYKNFRGQLAEFKEELIAEGDYLLLLAISRFNPNVGSKFSSYAYTTIQYGLYEYLDIKLKGYKRKINKHKDGTSTMETIRPTFISMDKSETDTGDSICFNDYHGTEDDVYLDTEFKLSIDVIINELKERGKKEKLYSYCGEIIECFVYKPELNKSEICKYLGISTTTMDRKVKLIREYFIKNNYKGLLV